MKSLIMIMESEQRRQDDPMTIVNTHLWSTSPLIFISLALGIEVYRWVLNSLLLFQWIPVMSVSILFRCFLEGVGSRQLLSTLCDYGSGWRKGVNRWSMFFVLGVSGGWSRSRSFWDCEHCPSHCGLHNLWSRQSGWPFCIVALFRGCSCPDNTQKAYNTQTDVLGAPLGRLGGWTRDKEMRCASIHHGRGKNSGGRNKV